MKSRYENIDTDTTEMKELITDINKRFDQTYKQINQLDEKIEAIHKDVSEMKSDVAQINEKLDKLLNRL